MWDKKNLQYKNKQLRARLWEDQAVLMELPVNHIQIAYRDLRDWNTKLHKPTKSGQAPREPTEREKILMSRFIFIKDTVKHRVAPVQTIAAALQNRDRDPDEPTDLEEVERMETQAGAVAAINQADSYTTTGTPINPKKKKRTEEDHLNENLIQQLSNRDAHLEKLTDRLTAMQESSNRNNTPRKRFCDWVTSELMEASDNEFREYEKSFLALRESWTSQRLYDQQKQRHQQQQRQQQQDWQGTSSSPQFQQHPSTWATQNPLPATTVWGSQNPGYNQNYMEATSGLQQRHSTPQSTPQRTPTSTLTTLTTVTTPPMPPPASPSGFSEIIANAPTPSSNLSLNLDLFDGDLNSSK